MVSRSIARELTGEQMEPFGSSQFRRPCLVDDLNLQAFGSADTNHGCTGVKGDIAFHLDRPKQR